MRATSAPRSAKSALRMLGVIWMWGDDMAPSVSAPSTAQDSGEPSRRVRSGASPPRDARAMKLLIGLVIIIALAYLGYRMFFVNARGTRRR